MNRKELLRQIREADCLLAAIPPGGPPFSAVHRWRESQRRLIEARRRYLRRQLGKLPKARWWKPRPASRVDARIARQYNDLSAMGSIC